MTTTAPATTNRPIAFLLALACIGLIIYGISTSAIELITLACLLLIWLLLALCFRTRWTFWLGLGLVLVGIFAQSLTLYMIDPLSIHQRKENMRTLLAAFHEYDKVHGHLPCYASFNPQGRPLLSWRVLLLPHLGEEQLYQEFHLDEPWNSPHNLKLLPRIPEVYRPVERMEHDTSTGCSIIKTRTHPGFTHIAAIRGSGSVFDSKIAVNIAQMSSNTLLLAEAAELIIWTKPEDVIVHRDSPTPSFHAYQSGRGFTVLGYLNGSVVNCYENEKESAFLNDCNLLLERIACLPKLK